jgi:hypothetical protein
MEIATAFEALLPVADAHGAGPKSRTGNNGLPKARALRAEEPPETGEP